MSRNDARKLRRDPKGAYWDVKRNETGQVQSTEAGTVSNTSVTATELTTVAQIDAGDPNMVAFTSANATLSSGGTVAASATPFTFKLLRNGNTLSSTTGATTTVSFSLTNSSLTTPENDPSWTLQAGVAGGAVTVAGTFSREQRW